MERFVVNNSDDGCLCLQFARGQRATIQQSVVSRSPVLSNIVSAADDDEHATIEVPFGYLQAWLDTVGTLRLDPSIVRDLDGLVMNIKVCASVSWR